MKLIQTACLVCIGLCFSMGVHGQLPSNRIRPGTMYYPGDTVSSPRLGLQAQIPDGWEGVMPRESEVFLLMSVNNVNGQIYVAANEHIGREEQMKRWKVGIEFEGGLRLVPDGEIAMRGEVLSVRGKMVGQNANNASQIYLEGKCSPYGFCLTYMLMADKTSLEAVKKALLFLVDHTSFTKPSTESPYLHFDWKKFLSGKVLLMIDYEQTSKKEDEVNFCGDGTFYSNITRRGLFKEQAKGYHGSKKGTWAVESKGEKAVLTFSFPKLPDVVVRLEIKNEEIYANGNRYFIGSSEKCK